MNTSNIILPIQWFIARISYLEQRLSSYALIRTGYHNKKPVVRVYSSGSSNKYKEVSNNSNQYESLYLMYKERLKLENEIATLKKKLSNYYGKTYANERSNWIVTPNTDNKLNMNFYNQLKESECSFGKETVYISNGRNFRSRLELVVAECIELQGIEYKYDSGVHLYSKKLFPDFVLVFPEFNRCVFLEIMGMLNDSTYVHDCAIKITEYSLAGYHLGIDLHILGSNRFTIPNLDLINTVIVNIVNTLCAQYIKHI